MGLYGIDLFETAEMFSAPGIHAHESHAFIIGFYRDGIQTCHF